MNHVCKKCNKTKPAAARKFSRNNGARNDVLTILVASKPVGRSGVLKTGGVLAGFLLPWKTPPVIPIAKTSESTRHAERATSVESAKALERAKVSESAITAERAMCAESATETERAKESESTNEAERARLRESTTPGKRAKEIESTKLLERATPAESAKRAERTRNEREYQAPGVSHTQ